MSPITRIAALAIAVCVAAVASCTRTDPTSSATSGDITVAEARASEIEAALKNHQGKVVVVDCWATWCAPCVKKFPHLVELHQKFADKGLVCLSVSMDKVSDADSYNQEKVQKFLQAKGATFPNFIVAEPEKDEKALNKLLGDFSFIPYMVIFDRNGRRVWTSDESPKLDDKQLEKKIESLLVDKP